MFDHKHKRWQHPAELWAQLRGKQSVVELTDGFIQWFSHEARSQHEHDGNTSVWRHPEDRGGRAAAACFSTQRWGNQGEGLQNKSTQLSVICHLITNSGHYISIYLSVFSYCSFEYILMLQFTLVKCDKIRKLFNSQIRFLLLHSLKFKISNVSAFECDCF